jgi:hypothetical protein
MSKVGQIHNLADSLNYSGSKLAVLKKQFLAASAKIRHKMARNPFLYDIL